jgi:hypothetical protein
LIVAYCAFRSTSGICVFVAMVMMGWPP